MSNGHLSITHDDIFKASQANSQRLANLLISTPDPAIRIESQQRERTFLTSIIKDLIAELETNGDCSNYLYCVSELKNTQTEHLALIQLRSQLEHEIAEIIDRTAEEDLKFKTEYERVASELARAEASLAALNRRHKNQLDYITRKIEAMEQCQRIYKIESGSTTM